MQHSKWTWAEAASLLPCSLVLGKLLLAGLVGMVFISLAWAMGPAHPGGGWKDGPAGIALVLLLILSGLAGLVGMWAGTLLGAERLRRKSWHRRGVLLCLVAGMGAAGTWMATMARGAMPSGPWGWLFWAVLLVPPIVLGARQIYLLLRPAPPPGFGARSFPPR